MASASRNFFIFLCTLDTARKTGRQAQPVGIPPQDSRHAAARVADLHVTEVM